jgi:hypothetical protein
LLLTCFFYRLQSEIGWIVEEGGQLEFAQFLHLEELLYPGAELRGREENAREAERSERPQAELSDLELGGVVEATWSELGGARRKGLGWDLGRGGEEERTRERERDGREREREEREAGGKEFFKGRGVGGEPGEVKRN